MPEFDQKELTQLRQRLYHCAEYQAEEIDPDDRKRWLVDVFAGEDDPVQEIVDKILWNEDGSALIGIAGGSGVGKTTQIYRLIDQLRSHRVLGIRVGYDDFSSLSSPPDITDFLLSICGGLAVRALELGHLPEDWDEKHVDAKILGILKRLKFEPELAVGPLSIKASLQEDETFRSTLRDHMAGQVSALVNEVGNFVDELVKCALDRSDLYERVVLVVDSTERLLAPASAELQMQNAVRNLFVHNADNLRLSSLDCVVLLPAWLPISDGGAFRFDHVVFPSVRIARRDDSDDERGLALLDEIIRKRMPDIEKLVASDDLVEVCRASGGVQRVLFSLLKSVAVKAGRANQLPVESEIVQSAIDKVTQDYLAITAESAPALRHIDDHKHIDGLDQESLDRLGKYFQALVILQVANGEKWFTIHPMMRARLTETELLQP